MTVDQASRFFLVAVCLLSLGNVPRFDLDNVASVIRETFGIFKQGSTCFENQHSFRNVKALSRLKVDLK